MINQNQILNFLFVGAKGTGKTSIIKHFIDNKFPDYDNETIGVTTYSTLNYNESYDLIFNEIGNSGIKIWEDNKLSKSILNILKISIIIIFVYDVNEKSTMKYIEGFYTLIPEQCKKNIIKIVVGNKKDLDQDNKNNETIQLGKKFAQEISCGYFLISAKDINDLNKLFKNAINKYLISKKDLKISFNRSESAIRENNKNALNRNLLTKDNKDEDKHEDEDKSTDEIIKKIKNYFCKCQ